MSRSSFYSKFKTSIEVLKRAVEGTIDLDNEHPKIYRKVYKYYQDCGVQLYDDPDDDYEIILNQLENDLVINGVLV